MLNLAEPHVLSLEPYIPGRAIENDARITSWAKLGSNENCLGPSQAAVQAAAKSLSSAHLYPNANRLLVIDKICEHLKDYDVRPQNVALGNGTSELIVNLCRGVLSVSEAMLYGWPSFIMYRQAAIAHGRKDIAVPVNADMSYDLDGILREARNQTQTPVKMIIVANPNNPTGHYYPYDTFMQFLKEVPKDIVLVIDEAYFEYVRKDDYKNVLSYALTRPRTIVLRTFSKVYGLAGLRLGYGIGDKELINVLCRIRDPFNVNNVVQHAAIAALADTEHLENSVMHNLEYKPQLMAGLEKFGFHVYDSVCNFMMIKRNEAMPSIADLTEELISRGVIIRPLHTYDLDDYARITVGTKREIEQLLAVLDTVLNSCAAA